MDFVLIALMDIKGINVMKNVIYYVLIIATKKAEYAIIVLMAIIKI